jgi:alginate biosynthesis protein AlgX
MIGRTLLILATILAPSLAWAESVFGCRDLAGRHASAAVEGADGVFYRIDPDLMMHHPFSPETVAQLAELSTVLAAGGTRLVYVPLPTKALAMPGQVPQAARDHGFDSDIATTVYDLLITDLREAGIATVDARRVLLATPQPFFQADPRLTPAGAAALGPAMAAIIAETPPTSATVSFATEATGPVEIESVWRARLQVRCLIDLPPVTAMATATVRLDLAGGGTETFGATSTAPRIALIGSDMTSLAATNLAGQLATAAGMEVIHYAVQDGGAYGAIAAYLTSAEFQAARPAVLVWENPVYYPLSNHGDQPMRELIAAAGAACRAGLPIGPGPEPGTLIADLSSLPADPELTLLLETGETAARSVRFDFADAAGAVRSRFIERPPEALSAGRFYMPLTGLWPEGMTRLTITLDQPVGGGARLMVCGG